MTARIYHIPSRGEVVHLPLHRMSPPRDYAATRYADEERLVELVDAWVANDPPSRKIDTLANAFVSCIAFCCDHWQPLFIGFLAGFVPYGIALAWMGMVK